MPIKLLVFGGDVLFFFWGGGEVPTFSFMGVGIFLTGGAWLV